MSKTDWEKLKAMKDEEIDLSDIPAATGEQMARAVPLGQLFPELIHQQYTVALDEDVAEWALEVSENQHQDFDEIVNQILREYISQRESLEETLRRVIREELHSATA